MKNEMRTEFLSTSENESFARMVAAAFVLELDPTMEELSEIKTAISEAVTNAIIHGYENAENKFITITGRTTDNVVIFTVSDKGTGIENIKKAREPLYSGAKNSERSGMGFTIMEAFMDYISVESSLGQGTSVIMKKTINGGKQWYGW